MAIILHLAPGTPEVGLWCPECLKPSGYMVPIYALSPSGVGRLGTLRKCHDCYRPLSTEGDK